MPPGSNSLTSQSFSTRSQISSLVTRYMAAQIISSPDFPMRSRMPKPLPPPFLNFGHQVLMDYGLLVGTVWSVAEEVKAAVLSSAHKRARLFWRLSAIGLTILAVVLAASILAAEARAILVILAIGMSMAVLLLDQLKLSRFKLAKVETFLLYQFVYYKARFLRLAWTGGSLVLVTALLYRSESFFIVDIVFIGAGFALVFLFRAYFLDRLKSRIAIIRAQAVRRLLDDEYQAPDKHVPIRPETYGDGALGTDRIPVLTVLDDEDPFSGYGRLQADNVFVCRKKAEAAQKLEVRSVEFYDLKQQVRHEIEECVHRLGMADSRCGEVVVLDGNTLAIDSQWLDGDKAPLLWLPHHSLSRLPEIDPRAAARVFFAVQILFPNHLSAATFFIRLFAAGNALAFQIAVTTMGPPTITQEELVARLIKHSIEEDKVHDSGEHIPSGASRRKLTDATREGLDGLDAVHGFNQLTSAFKVDLNLDEVIKLSAIQETQREEAYAIGFSKMVKRSAIWLGRRSGASSNWRAANSYTFPADFFGHPESLATVRAVYSQLVRLSLDRIDEAGFDVSEYRDKEGKYIINAEKIDQIVVGERIQLTEHKKPIADVAERA